MAATLIVHDERTSGERTHSVTLSFSTEKVDGARIDPGADLPGGAGLRRTELHDARARGGVSDKEVSLRVACVTRRRMTVYSIFL